MPREVYNLKSYNKVYRDLRFQFENDYPSFIHNALPYLKSQKFDQATFFSDFSQLDLFRKSILFPQIEESNELLEALEFYSLASFKAPVLQNEMYEEIT